MQTLLMSTINCNGLSTFGFGMNQIQGKSIRKNANLPVSNPITLIS